MKQIDQNKHKRTALITEKSCGIGYELSKLFAQDGYNLVMVARNKQKLEQIADEFKEKFSISTKVIPKDLCTEKSPEEIFYELQQESIRIDILVNNAGYNEYGFFSETEKERMWK
ncbi:MAG: SDR family NAD(P)-dependent oxidoreductase [Candidatus Aminicenantia bacterium]